MLLFQILYFVMALWIALAMADGARTRAGKVGTVAGVMVGATALAVFLSSTD